MKKNNVADNIYGSSDTGAEPGSGSLPAGKKDLSGQSRKKDSIEPQDDILAQHTTVEIITLYIKASERLALLAYEATQVQQQNNVLAQQTTVNGIRSLYSIFKP